MTDKKIKFEYGTILLIIIIIVILLAFGWLYFIIWDKEIPNDPKTENLNSTENLTKKTFDYLECKQTCHNKTYYSTYCYENCKDRYKTEVKGTCNITNYLEKCSDYFQEGYFENKEIYNKETQVKGGGEYYRCCWEEVKKDTNKGYLFEEKCNNFKKENSYKEIKKIKKNITLQECGINSPIIEFGYFYNYIYRIFENGTFYNSEREWEPIK
jgi:hypothetical protein